MLSSRLTEITQRDLPTQSRTQVNDQEQRFTGKPRPQPDLRHCHLGLNEESTWQHINYAPEPAAKVTVRVQRQISVSVQRLEPCCASGWFLISHHALGCSLPGTFQQLETVQVHRAPWLGRQRALGAAAEEGHKGGLANPTTVFIMTDFIAVLPVWNRINSPVLLEVEATCNGKIWQQTSCGQALGLSLREVGTTPNTAKEEQRQELHEEVSSQGSDRMLILVWVKYLSKQELSGKSSNGLQAKPENKGLPCQQMCPGLQNKIHSSSKDRLQTPP